MSIKETAKSYGPIGTLVAAVIAGGGYGGLVGEKVNDKLDVIQTDLSHALEWGGDARVRQINRKVAEWRELLAQPGAELAQVQLTKRQIQDWINAELATKAKIEAFLND